MTTKRKSVKESLKKLTVLSKRKEEITNERLKLNQEIDALENVVSSMATVTLRLECGERVETRISLANRNLGIRISHNGSAGTISIPVAKKWVKDLTNLIDQLET